ncbi:olfactory receptor 5AP2-like [Discoglossus pictus]
MEFGNTTRPRAFILLGFYEWPDLQYTLFMMFLIIYLVTLTGNITIVTVIFIDPHLHTPMYFFLCNLSFLDITITSIVLPKLLHICLTGNQSITYMGCVTQMFFFVICLVAEYFLLAVMAYDRYVAICHPLRYPYLMNMKMIRSNEGKKKAFSTCSSHLTIVTLFFGIILSMSMRPKSAYSIEQDKVFSVLYTSCIPMLNPFIYNLRNKDVKEALQRQSEKIQRQIGLASKL